MCNHSFSRSDSDDVSTTSATTSFRISVDWSRVIHCRLSEERVPHLCSSFLSSGKPNESNPFMEVILCLDNKQLSTLKGLSFNIQRQLSRFLGYNETNKGRKMVTLYQIGLNNEVDDTREVLHLSYCMGSANRARSMKLCRLLFSANPDIGVEGHEFEAQLIQVIRRHILHFHEPYQLDSPIPCRRPYLIFLNREAGTRNAQKLFLNFIHSIFQCAGVPYETIVTEYRNHVMELIRDCDVDQYSGIVSVSGDGLCYEILNGILQRPDWSETLQRLKLGVLGAGSGNALAASVLHLALQVQTSTEWLTEQGTLMLCRPQCVPLDLIMVEFADGAEDGIRSQIQRRYAHHPERQQAPEGCSPKRVGHCVSFLSVTFGIIADIDIDSEILRFLGGARFTLTALIKILASRKYRALLQYLPSHKVNAMEHTPGPSDDKAHAQNSRKTKIESYEEAVSNEEQYWEIDSKPHLIKPDEMKRIHREESAGNDHTNPPYEWRHLPPLWEKIEQTKDSRWVHRDETFITVSAMYQTHLSSDTIVSPGSKFFDGIIYLLIIKDSASRLDLLQTMLAMETGEHISLPQVEMIAVEAFRLTPMDSRGIIAVDGERIPFGPVQAEVWPNATQILCHHADYLPPGNQENMSNSELDPAQFL